MSEKNSESRREFWSRLSKEQRSERMRDVALKRWFVISPEDRRIYALKMVKGKRDKNVSTK